jgi:hypothetical protein
VAEQLFHQLVPEGPNVTPTVGVDTVWGELVAAIAASPAKDRLFWSLKERDVADNRHRARLRIQETAVAIFNICLRNRLFTPRINGAGRFYQVPNAAFIPPFASSDGMVNADATTWAQGKLHRLDAPDEFRWIAAGRYALLLTENEAAAIREQARRMIAEGEREHRLETQDRILDRARRGEITAREAEAEAERRGLGKLASCPPAEDFDPCKRPAWTLPMALAWIAWRSFDEVREWDSEYRDACLEWRTSTDGPEGRRLQRRDAATVWEFECMGYLRVSELEGGATERELDVDLPKRTKAALWAALRAGKGITADGIPGGGPRRPIPAIQWEDLESFERNGGRDALCFHHAPDRVAYERVRITQAQILARWPPTDTKAEKSSPDTNPEAVTAPIEPLPKSGRPSIGRDKTMIWLVANPQDAERLTNKRIALLLGVSDRTVERAKKTLRGDASDKMDRQNRQN